MKDMRKLFVVLLAFVGMQLSAQDMVHYKRLVKELASAKYQGRGYAKGGANKAGKFLEKEYRKAGVDEVTLQPFTLDIQTFAGKMEMQTLSNSPLKGEEKEASPLRGGLEGSLSFSSACPSASWQAREIT